MKEDVFAYIDDHKAQMMDLWQDLVNQDSPASYREGVDLVAKRVSKNWKKQAQVPDGMRKEKH